MYLVVNFDRNYHDFVQRFHMDGAVTTALDIATLIVTLTLLCGALVLELCEGTR